MQLHSNHPTCYPLVQQAAGVQQTDGSVMQMVEDLAAAAKKEGHRKSDDYQAAAELLRLNRHDPNLKEPTCNFLGRGHHLGVDNYFSSPQLFQELYQQGTTATGTVRSNRKGLPRQAVNKKLRNNETAERRKGNLLCVAYKDGQKKPILLSTAVSVGFQPHVTRHGRHVQRPKIVLKYNQSMGGVDLSDARLYKYLSERRTMKWTNKVVFSIIGRAVLNCFILYSQNTSDNPKLSRHQFMVELVESLAGNYYPDKVVRRRRTQAEIRAARMNPNLQGAAAQPAQPQPGLAGGPAAGPGGHHWPRKVPNGKHRDCSAAMNLVKKPALRQARGPKTSSGTRQPPMKAFMDDFTVTTESLISAKYMPTSLGKDDV
ncbi:uncharacterized protein LOC144872080 [Branchiostoma floridae x Branchiostoma japonicum]